MILSLFMMFFKIGLFTFGGGYAMLPLIQEEVSRRGLMELSEMVSFIAVSESTPGPFAVNIATYVGLRAAGFWGAAASTLGVVMPSFIVILIVAKMYERFRKSRLISGAFYALRPAAIGLLLSAAVSVGGSVFFPSGFVLDWKLALALIIFVLTLVLALKKVHPIKLMALSALMGLMGMYALDLMGAI